MLTHVPDWVRSVAAVRMQAHDEITTDPPAPVERGTISAHEGERYMAQGADGVWRPAAVRRQEDGLLGILEVTTWP